MVRVISFVACFGAGWGSKNPGFVEVTRILVFSKGLQPIRINELLVSQTTYFTHLLSKGNTDRVPVSLLRKVPYLRQQLSPLKR